MDDGEEGEGTGREGLDEFEKRDGDVEELKGERGWCVERRGYWHCYRERREGGRVDRRWSRWRKNQRGEGSLQQSQIGLYVLISYL